MTIDPAIFDGIADHLAAEMAVVEDIETLMPLDANGMRLALRKVTKLWMGDRAIIDALLSIIFDESNNHVERGAIVDAKHGYKTASEVIEGMVARI